MAFVNGTLMRGGFEYLYTVIPLSLSLTRVWGRLCMCCCLVVKPNVGIAVGLTSRLGNIAYPRQWASNS